MRSISNNFVTIDYDTPEKEKAVKCCIDLFDSDEELYKVLLKGRTNINIDEIVDYTIFNLNNDISDIQNSINKDIVESLLKLNLKDVVSVIEASDKVLFLDMIIIYLKPEKNFRQEYFDFAYYYYLNTGDYSYLLKYVKDQDYDEDDLYTLIDYIIFNDLEELLKAKISFSIDQISCIPDMNNNIRALGLLLTHILDRQQIQMRETQELLQKKYYDGIIPNISREDFNKLILEATEYIDPSLGFTEELLKLLKDNKLRFNNSNEERFNCFDFKKGEIVLTPTGTIEDVITFMHEFGHLWYYGIENDINNSNSIFSEFPSIYFELKAVEFLKNRGYTEEEVDASESFRREHDFIISPFISVTILGIFNNIGKDEKDYDVGRIINFLDNKIEESDGEKLGGYNDYIIDAYNKLQPYRKRLFLTAEPIITEPIKYLLGSYLAEHSINNLDHEEIMESMKKIKQEDCDLYSAFKILGLDPEEFGFKKTKETKVNKRLSLKREDS